MGGDRHGSLGRGGGADGQGAECLGMAWKGPAGLGEPWQWTGGAGRGYQSIALGECEAGAGLAWTGQGLGRVCPVGARSATVRHDVVGRAAVGLGKVRRGPMGKEEA